MKSISAEVRESQDVARSMTDYKQEKMSKIEEEKGRQGKEDSSSLDGFLMKDETPTNKKPELVFHAE